MNTGRGILGATPKLLNGEKMELRAAAGGLAMPIIGKPIRECTLKEVVALLTAGTLISALILLELVLACAVHAYRA